MPGTKRSERLMEGAWNDNSIERSIGSRRECYLDQLEVQTGG